MTSGCHPAVKFSIPYQKLQYIKLRQLCVEQERHCENSFNPVVTVLPPAGLDGALQKSVVNGKPKREKIENVNCREIV
jgi:hypothetical protein